MSGLPVPEWDWYPAPDLPNVAFGEGCWLYSAQALSHVRTRRPCGLRVGERTGLYDGTWLDLGPEAELHIGSYCTIVGALVSSNSRIRIGDYCFFSSEVLIVDRPDAVPPVGLDPEEYAERMPPLARATTLGDDVWIGPRVTILGGVSIGDGAVVGAGAVVVEDVPPWSVAVGNPARVVGATVD